MALLNISKSAGYAIYYGFLLQVIEGVVLGLVFIFTDIFCWLGLVPESFFSGWDMKMLFFGPIAIGLLRYFVGLNGPLLFLSLYFFFRERDPTMDGYRSVIWFTVINAFTYFACLLIFFSWFDSPLYGRSSTRINSLYVYSIASLISPYILVKIVSLIRNRVNDDARTCLKN